MNNKQNLNIFGDSMRIFLDYIARQINKNPDYKPHPIIRAFECALSDIENCSDWEKRMWISQEGTENNIYEPYVVVLEKKWDSIEVLEIRNLKIDKTMPIDFMITIFRLQIHLDKIEGDTVNPQQMVDALNSVIPGNKYYALGDRWKEARELFRLRMEKWKISLPVSMRDSDLEKELLSITYETPWEDYSNRLRQLIGTSILEVLEWKKPQIIITSPTNSKIEKFKVFDTATQFSLWKISDYLNNKLTKQYNYNKKQVKKLKRKKKHPNKIKWRHKWKK